MTERYYTGIGSRKTPQDVLEMMTATAGALGVRGFILRSGGAAGADTAFEAGVTNPEGKEIYLPWPGYNGNQSPLHAPPSREALSIAATIHPAWNRCSDTVKKMHARNCHQVLGADLKTPSLFVLCWTEGGQLKGGTAQALRLADLYDIPVYNLGDPSLDALPRLLRDFPDESLSK